MLISRGVKLLNHISKHPTRKNMLTATPPTRFSHDWVYRPHADPAKVWLVLGDVANATLWCWFLYRLANDYYHFSEHWPYPDPSKWTNEELGIPPDDSD